jgi:predicted lipoprotein with Yx(FWY)xxD motif
MLHQRITIAAVGAVAAVVVGAALLTGSLATSHAAGPTVSSNVVQAHSASVGGTKETVVTDARGLPLYYFAPDRATRSLVSGGLAALWPPVVTSTARPTAIGLPGKLTVVHNFHGNQLAYNGHLLYTFVSDRRDVVTGQGVQNFFVVTPKLSALARSAASNPNTNTSPYNGY